MTDIDNEVNAIRERKTALVFKAGPDKPKVKASLTPVGTERTAATLPNDLPGLFLSSEALALAAADLRKHAATLITAAEGIELLIGADPAGSHKAMLAAQAAEVALMQQEADRKAADRAKADAGNKAAQARVEAVTPESLEGEREAFEQRFARISAEAQAQAFSGNMVPAAQEIFGDMLVIDAGSASDDPTWVCPVHGAQAIRTLTRRSTGKTYRACESCAQFEK